MGLNCSKVQAPVKSPGFPSKSHDSSVQALLKPAWDAKKKLMLGGTLYKLLSD